MSVLRAEVKSVARVAEVGRIRVTDQRAPRERSVGGALGLIESAYREQNSRSVYPIIRPPSFLNSPYTRSLSLFHRVLPSFSFVIILVISFASCYSMWLSCVRGFHLLSLPRSRFLLHSALSFLLACSLSPPLVSRSLLSISLSYRRSFFSLVCSLFLVLSPAERYHPEAAFVSFVLIRLLRWPVRRSFVSLSRFLRKKRTEPRRTGAHALHLLFLFFLPFSSSSASLPHIFCFFSFVLS